ncbi:flagellar hook-basal body complex protein [Rosistilla oblonga]|uniref:Flagellar hook protein FlgE n=1 Tax=Rosistilla oblonga TaxID=2527990 RepID=A0A518IPN0_9BACT|nr:flagellar hook-basal body complex protein [Rosistilla oblonga]QDV55032.1 Flagellar hook protein FlgE [Rosistilla oblonga]
MGLASALSTALTGLSAAETQIDVIGNNLANAQTVGFKASTAVFATQFLQTQSLGAAPTAENGGTNPRQVGLGVQVAEITSDFTQGTIEISSTPSHLAIQGEGFFIVESSQGENLFTRNGIFKLNSENQLTTATGQRLLGFGADESFRIEETQLKPITIPLGSESVAKSTTEVTFEGTLTPQGEVADVSQVIQSAILGDAAVPRPDGGDIEIGTSPVPASTGVTTAVAGGGALAAGNYQYRFTYVDNAGRETVPSAAVSVNAATGQQITLGNLPASPSPEYTSVNIYRTDAGGTEFFQLDTAATGATYIDDGTTPLSATELDTDTLSGNYTYMVTYHKSGSTESIPSVLIGPQNVVDGRITLDDFPIPPTPPTGGGFPEYDEIRIYRNLANDQNNFYLVDSVSPYDTYTDSRSDAEIADLNVAGNKLLDLDGPTINSNTLLTNVLKRDGLNYSPVFTVGTMSYQGEKGDRLLGTQELEITATSTVQDLIDFVEAASGIQILQVDSQNPIPGSENNIPGETGTLIPGGYIQDGAIRFVSNTGELNALDIDLTSFRIEDDLGNVTVPNLAFGTIQEAEGTSAVADLVVYDSLGNPLDLRVTTTLEERTDEQTVYRWYADSSENQSTTSSGISVGTGLIRFDGNGNFISASNSTVNINRSGSPSVSPLQFDLDFTSVSGLATETASLAATRQDGSAPGVLTSYVIGEDGIVRGVFSNGVTRDLGQIQLARFANPAGLDARGQNLYAQGINTGLPVQGGPGENGIGAIRAGALELSNTDMGADLVDLVLAGTQYRGNTRVITSTQELLDELLNLAR